MARNHLRLLTGNAIESVKRKLRQLEPVELGPKEGLALINGTQVSTAVGALAAREALSLLAHADLAGCLSLEAVKGSAQAFDHRIISARPHPGALTVAMH